MNKIQVACFKGSMQYEYDGEFFYVTADVPPETVAHGLAAVSRFGGQTEQPFSVAEHSVRLGWLLREYGYGPAFEKAALLHDAPEAFGLGDQNTFVKRALNPEKYRALDREIVTALWKSLGCEAKCGLEWEDVERPVHKFDKWLGHHEAKTFGFYMPPEINFDPTLYARRGSGMPLSVGYWGHGKAKEAWLWNWEHADGRR